MSPFDGAAVIVGLAAVLGWANARFIRLPRMSGLTVLAAGASMLALVGDRLFAHLDLAGRLRDFLSRIDLHRALMGGMLSFLLFGGALHVDGPSLRRAWRPVAVLSTVSLVVSTVVIGAGTLGVARLFHLPLDWRWCLAFGALLSPTDPVAVLEVLRGAGRGEPVIDGDLGAIVGAESLFNDGAAVVLFSVLLAWAQSGQAMGAGEIGRMLIVQAGGGILLGVAMGVLAFLMMSQIDDYGLEVLITVALAMGGYALAWQLGVSGPVAMAMAGLLVGNPAARHAMSATTRDYLIKFWDLVGEILNAALFVIIGLEAIAVVGSVKELAAGVLVTPIALFARMVSVGAAMVLRPRMQAMPAAWTALVWGGLRGGICVALALALPSTPAKPFLLVATYVAVLLSLVVQAPTVGPLVRRRLARTAAAG